MDSNSDNLIYSDIVTSHSTQRQVHLTCVQHSVGNLVQFSDVSVQGGDKTRTVTGCPRREGTCLCTLHCVQLQGKLVPGEPRHLLLVQYKSVP